MTWGGIAVSAFTVACAPWLIGLLLGPRFKDAVPVLQWHAVTNVFVFMGIAQMLAIVSERTPRVALLKTLVGVFVSIIANMMLIPRWGAIGSACAAVSSYCCSAVLSNVFLAPKAFRIQMKAFIPTHG
jgi:O-antigen/teichoic acid export membrane protein